MSIDSIAHLPRGERRAILAREAKNRAEYNWGPWNHKTLPTGTGGCGWNMEVRAVHWNSVFSVLERPTTGATHFAITSLSGIRPSFHEIQRIKNELAGPDATAVEVYPPQSELVDEADMFHFFVVDPLPFSIFKGRK